MMTCCRYVAFIVVYLYIHLWAVVFKNGALKNIPIGCSGTLPSKSMGIETLIMDIEEWKKNNSYPAPYAHFDYRVGISKKWDYITTPSKVEKHAFLPFIYYEQIYLKYSATKQLTRKSRPICYAAHVDRCIYKYYSYLINEKYNEFVAEKGISENIVAYRNDLTHNNNIYHANRAFEFIKKGECKIIVGDFKGFFDNLNHGYLKKKLKKILNVSDLPNDYYAIFKNITKYSKWELSDLINIRFQSNLPRAADMKNADKCVLREFSNLKAKINKSKIVLSKEEYKKIKSKFITKNTSNVGIPQGSPISAVLSNVYMIDFDSDLSHYIKNIGGLYMRYCDDFIIIIPANITINIDDVSSYLNELVEKTKGLSLHKDKTNHYSYKNNEIIHIYGKNIHHLIDYLGFHFDGKKIAFRPKTLTKYFYKMYRKLKYIIKCKERTKHGNKISYRNLYSKYTQKGRNTSTSSSKKFDSQKGGNFITYAYKSMKIFKDKCINKFISRHMLKIRRKRNRMK